VIPLCFMKVRRERISMIGSISLSRLTGKASLARSFYSLSVSLANGSTFARQASMSGLVALAYGVRSSRATAQRREFAMEILVPELDWGLFAT
jgi:hypothetical protein